MKTNKYWSEFFKNRSEKIMPSTTVKEGAKVLAVGVFALLALGFFTTSQRLNAG